jgi:hypothetical protein
MALGDSVLGGDAGEQRTGPLLLAAHPLSAAGPFSRGSVGFSVTSQGNRLDSPNSALERQNIQLSRQNINQSPPIQFRKTYRSDSLLYGLADQTLRNDTYGSVTAWSRIGSKLLDPKALATAKIPTIPTIPTRKDIRQKSACRFHTPI